MAKKIEIIEPEDIALINSHLLALQNRIQTTEETATEIHSQLGELKYKVEKLDGDTKAMRDTPTGYAFRELCGRVEKLEITVSKNPQVYGNFTTSCTCSCTKSESDQLREKLSEIGEQIVDLGKTIQTL